MNLISVDCVEFNDKRKICVASENGKKYTLKNTSEFTIRKVKVDKCLMQAQGERRCDYLMSVDPKDLKRVIFIELKGSRLTDAVKQLYSTIGYLKGEFIDHQLDARIVGSRDVPQIRNTPDYVKLERTVRSTNGTIIISTNKMYVENI